MDPIIQTGAAAIFAGYAVALYKLGVPRTASWALVMIAIIAGVGSAFTVAIADAGMGAVQGAQGIAQTVLQGIGAAVAAAGLTRTDSAGEAKREDAT